MTAMCLVVLRHPVIWGRIPPGLEGLAGSLSVA